MLIKILWVKYKQVLGKYWTEQTCSCGSVVEHCVSSAKVVGSIPRKHTY